MCSPECVQRIEQLFKECLQSIIQMNSGSGSLSNTVVKQVQSSPSSPTTTSEQQQQPQIQLSPFPILSPITFPSLHDVLSRVLSNSANLSGQSSLMPVLTRKKRRRRRRSRRAKVTDDDVKEG